MSRPVGSRNRDYDETRAALLDELLAHLLDDNGDPATMKSMAAAAGVSVPTLRHYFQDRDTLLVAAFARVNELSARHLVGMLGLKDPDPREVLPEVLLAVVGTWRRFGLGRVFASGLSLGLENPTVGPGFVLGVVEPLLQAIEGLLAEVADHGALPPMDTRAGALSLLSPVILALLHQDNLGGGQCRPLDVEAFIAQHVRVLVAGWLALA